MKIKLLIVYVLLTFSNSLFAEEFLAHCRDYKPELYFNGEKCEGVVPDLVTDILSELGHDISWVKVPWIRSLKEAREGRVDLLIRHSMTKERRLFLHPIAYGHQKRTLSFYKSPTFKSGIKSYDDLKEVIVGAIRGNYYSPDFSSLDTKTLVLVGKTEQLISMLELGRIDVAVSSASHSLELFKDQFEETIFIDSFYNPLYISIPKKSKAVKHIKDISKLMLEYRKNGKINQYFQKYGLQEPNQVFK